MARRDGPPHSTAPLGAKSLWNTPGLELPGEFRQMVRAIADSSGKSTGQAIQIAWGVLRRWASGTETNGRVTPKTRAKAVRLLAELDAARARAKATANKSGKRDRVAASQVALANRVTSSDPKSGTTTVSKADADDPRVERMAQKLIAGGYDRERAYKVATAVIRRGKSKKGGKVAASHSLALGNGPACKCGGPHDLVFYSERSTPAVVHPGDDAPQKQGYGKVTRRRRANASEQKQIANGQWIRVDQSGNKPGDSSYKTTKLRPGLVKASSTSSGGLALAGRHRGQGQRYTHGWKLIDAGGGAGKHAKPERFAEGASSSKRPPLDPQHVQDVRDRLAELRKHAPSIAARQRDHLNELHRDGKLTSDRLRIAKNNIERLTRNHRPLKPLTDADDLVHVGVRLSNTALELAAPTGSQAMTRRRTMVATKMSDSGSGPMSTKNTSSKAPTDAKAAAKAAADTSGGDEAKVEKAAQALIAKGWNKFKAYAAARKLVAKQKAGDASEDA